MKLLSSMDWNPGRLRQLDWHEYALRFAFGGAVTAAAGWIAAIHGPVMGGLFLAFPAILPASLTLIEQHTDRTRLAGVSAVGAMYGSLGLIAFAATVWGLAERLPSWAVLALALLAWLIVAVGAWALCRRVRPGRWLTRGADAPRKRVGSGARSP